MFRSLIHSSIRFFLQVTSLVILRSQSLVQVEEVFTENSLSTLLHYNLNKPEKWLGYAVKLLFKTVVIQKDAVYKKLCGNVDDKQDKTPPPSSDSHAKDQASKIDKLKILKEKAMHKHFFEATEGNKYTGALATDKFRDFASSDREQELMTDSIQCPIYHPANNTYLKILDSNISNLQKKLRKSAHNNEFGEKSQQKLWIPCYKTFGEEISSTKNQAVSFYLKNLGTLIDDGGCSLTSISLELVLFFVEMTSKVSLSQPDVLTFCESVIKLMSKMDETVTTATKCLIKCIVDKIMSERTFTSFFSTQLLELLHKMENSDQKQKSASWFGNQLADVSNMSIMRLASNEDMTDVERILLRKLVLQVDLKRFVKI